MDEYTRKTKLWLEERFRQTDERGIYKSHAPIYGFSKTQIALGLYGNNFAILKQIEWLISRYSINNILEVGCAEGYTAHLIENIFEIKVYIVDLSLEAVKRAQEIYSLRGIAADAQALSCIKSDSFDLVLCSETLEHVANPQQAFNELMRIAKKALIVTVPAAGSQQEKEDFIPKSEPHTHLNVFTVEELLACFNQNVKPVQQNGCVTEIRVRGICFKWLDNIYSLFTEEGKSASDRHSFFLARLYKLARLFFLPLRRLYGIKLAKLFIKLDYWLGTLGFLNAITYMAIYLKTQPGFDKKNPCRNILDFMLKENQVETLFK